MTQFVDGIAVINDSAEFKKIYHEMYPPKLKLKRTKRSDTEASLLDFDMKMINGEYF